MTTPTTILLKQINNPRRYTRWKLVRSSPKPLYYRRGEYYFYTREQLEQLAEKHDLTLVDVP